MVFVILKFTFLEKKKCRFYRQVSFYCCSLDETGLSPYHVVGTQHITLMMHTQAAEDVRCGSRDELMTWVSEL